jgi:enoyl-CoA hydratase/carnithine racemase
MIERSINSGVANVHLARPAKLNALDEAGWRDLTATVVELGRTAGVRAVVLSGDARAFCAGNDIDEFERLHAGESAAAYFLETVMPATEAIVCCPVPVVAAVRGVVFGGGLELVLACDLAVAGDTARFRLPESRIGVWPTVFAALAPYTLLHKDASMMALTGLEQDASAAARMGIVNEVVEDGNVLDRANELARGVAEGAPDAVRRTKAYVTSEIRRAGLPAVKAALDELSHHTIGGAEMVEGVRAFREKRKAAFQGTPEEG